MDPTSVADVDAGRSITLKRDPDYWGRDLPVNRGLFNFEELRFDYYRDANAISRPSRLASIDVRTENDPSRWQTAYDFPAVRDGRVIKEEFANGLPKVSADFVFNTRRAVFADIRVREAIALLFDFEWINRNFFFGLYRRSASFFEVSELSARGVPPMRASARCWRRFPMRCAPTSSMAPGRRRSPTDRAATARRLRAALAPVRRRRLRAQRHALRERASGRQLTLRDHGDEQRPGAARARLFRNLARAGIDAHVRMVDAVQYDQRQLSISIST